MQYCADPVSDRTSMPSGYLRVGYSACVVSFCQLSATNTGKSAVYREHAKSRSVRMELFTKRSSIESKAWSLG